MLWLATFGVAVTLGNDILARIVPTGAIWYALSALLASCGAAPASDAKQGSSTEQVCKTLDGGPSPAGVTCPGVTPSWPAGPEDDINGLPPAQAKYTSCEALWACAVAACQSMPEQDCLRPCLEAASTELVDAFSDVTKCTIHVCAKEQCAGASANSCMGECLWSRCLGFGVACSAPAGATGSSSCGDALNCVKSCNGQMSCLSTCYADMQASEQVAYLELWSCIATSDAADPFVDCYDMALACGGGEAAGAKSCYDLLQCSGACGDKLTSEEFNCNAKCYGEGSDAARQQFREVVNCYTGFAQGGEPGDCASVLAACVEPGGALTCPEIDPCSALCKDEGKSQGVCTFECLKRASPQEGQRFLELMLCGSVTCSHKCEDSSDKDCVEQCRQVECKTQNLSCLGA